MSDSMNHARSSKQLPAHDQPNPIPQHQPWCVQHLGDPRDPDWFGVCSAETLKLDFTDADGVPAAQVRFVDVLLSDVEGETRVEVAVNGYIGDGAMTVSQAEALAYGLLAMVEATRGHNLAADAYRELAVHGDARNLAGAR